MRSRWTAEKDASGEGVNLDHVAEMREAAILTHFWFWLTTTGCRAPSFTRSYVMWQPTALSHRWLLNTYRCDLTSLISTGENNNNLNSDSVGGSSLFTALWHRLRSFYRFITHRKWPWDRHWPFSTCSTQTAALSSVKVAVCNIFMWQN